MPRRGEVYDVDMEPVVGSELGKRRPAVVVSNNVGNRMAATVVIVPLTSAVPRDDFPFEARIPAGVAGVTMDSRAKADQIRTVDKQRLGTRRGMLPPEYLAAVETALRVQLSLRR